MIKIIKIKVQRALTTASNYYYYYFYKSNSNSNNSNINSNNRCQRVGGADAGVAAGKRLLMMIIVTS